MTAPSESSDLEARTSEAMRRFLDLEDEAPDELFEVLPGATVPFWALVRVQIFRILSAQQTGSVEVAVVNEWSRRKEATRVARSYLPNRWDAARFARRHDTVFYVPGVTVAIEGRRTRNWLVDEFAEAAGDALVVQVRPLPAPTGPPVFRPTLSMDPAIGRSRWRARGTSLPTGTAQAMDRLLAAFARHLDQPSDAFAKIATWLKRTELLRPHELNELERVLDRTRPRIVIFDNGSYTYHGEWVGLMKDAGAYVAEPQHGWIGPSHAAYNYGRAFQAPSLRRALPDELLTFGTYWSDSVRHPGVVTAIGKPHLARQVTAAPTERERRILVVSSRAEPESTDEFVVGLRAALGDGWSIDFRPHPGERAQTVDRYPRLSADPGVGIDLVPDVYESLKRSAVVVGEASTVLFEARAFGCTVIARESPFAATVIGDAFGARATGVAEVVGRLRQIPAKETVTADVDPALWAPDPVLAFQRWIAERRAALSPR